MKNLIKILSLMLLLMNSKTIYSQVTQEWTSRYGQAGIDGGNSIATDNLGNVYVAGSAGISPNYDIITIKYSASGQQEWLVSYNGPGNGNDGANTIKLDRMGNIVVAGSSTGIGTARDYVTIKYTPSGDQIWVRRYSSPGSNDDFGGIVAIDSMDNIYVTGESNEDYATIKYDSSGVQEWVKIYGTINNLNISRALSVDKFGNTYVTGESGGDSTNSIDIATIKYNSFGVQKWVARYNSSTSENDYGLAIGVDNERNVYVCGGSQGDLHYDDYIIVKYDSLGVEQWNRRYNGSANFLDQARSLVIDNSNNVYITGYSTHAGTGYDFTTIKYNTNGDQLWIARYNNGLNDMANDMIIDPYGNLYITGESDGSGTNKDYATVKYDSSGNLKWVMRYDYSGQYPDYPSSLSVDRNGCVYVTGQSNRDFLTIKYSQLTGANPLSLVIPSEFKLEQNYPNPFNPVTVIGYQLSVISNVKIKVYDVLGNEVATLVNERKNPGNYKVGFDGSNLPSGIYFYRLEADGNIVATKRMLLLK